MAQRLVSALYRDESPFDDLFEEYGVVVHHPDDLMVGDVLILWGGEDISPAIYGDQLARRGGGSFPGLSRRDAQEVALARKAIDMGCPIIGICRGAQLMWALAGGKLIQDVSNHTSSHAMITDDGRLIRTSSLHHQMLHLETAQQEYKLIAWAPNRLSTTYQGGNNEELEVAIEPEVLWIPGVKALCIQGHPEFHRMDDPYVVYCRELVTQYVRA